jgi:hypothetical protein
MNICYAYTGAAQKRAMGNIRSRLEERLCKGGGHLEDVVFKKY